VRRRTGSRMEANDNHLILEGSSSVPTTEEVLKESEKSRKRIVKIQEENNELHTRVAIDILTIRELEELKEESERTVREPKEKPSGQRVEFGRRSWKKRGVV